jgi:integrase
MVIRKLKETLTEYLENNQDLKYNTRQTHKYAWAKLVECKGDILVSELAYNDMEDFKAYLFNQGLQPGAVKSYLKMCRPVLNRACRRRYREGDPFVGLKLPRVPKAEIRFYSDAELSAMLGCANLLWQARIIASASAGLRKGENLNLTLRDIDFDEGYISVQPKRRTDRTWPWSPKSYECRRVPLTEQLIKILVLITDELPVGQPYVMLTEKRYWHLRQLLLKGKLPERVMGTPDENFRPFQKIKENAGITDGTFHDLRRTCITRWTWNLAPQEVKKLAGHADLKTTLEFYSAIRADVLQRAHHTVGATGLEPATS